MTFDEAAAAYKAHLERQARMFLFAEPSPLVSEPIDGRGDAEGPRRNWKLRASDGHELAVVVKVKGKLLVRIATPLEADDLHAFQEPEPGSG